MDLGLVPIEELLQEFDKRFDANVILTCKIINKDSELYEFHQYGGHFTVLGMCEQFAYCLKDKKEQEETDGFYKD